MASFKELISSEQPVLVDFHATWCGPCQVMAPMLKEVASSVKDKARILKIDVDKNPAVAQQYQVRGVPTLILFQNGEVKWRQSGVVPVDTLVDVINQHQN